MSQETRLATPEDVADFLGIPVATLYQWRYAGKGPQAIKVGKHLRWRWSDVETWLQTQESD